MGLSKELIVINISVIPNLQIERRKTSSHELYCTAVKHKTGLNSDTILPGITVKVF